MEVFFCIPSDQKPKIIHCTRNPKDVICSGFDFFQKVNMLKTDNFDDYFWMFVQ